MHRADLIHSNDRLESKLRHIYSLNRQKNIDFGDGGFRQPYIDVLRDLGNPHLKLPPVIHVAGTNGKGSVVAMLRAMLQAAGHRVHVYTSPHLVKFNERIVLANQQIDDAALEALIDEVLDVNDGRPLTFFEITTAMAFAAFSRIPADIALIEVGMGGRLDCTNIIQKPLVSIITSIGMDHAEYLGDTLAAIAAEKAGIIKPGVPCVLGYQSAEAINEGVICVFESKAQQENTPLFCAGSAWRAQRQGHQIMFQHSITGQGRESFFPLPNLQGAHQIENFGAALAALTVAAPVIQVTDAAKIMGATQIDWPARIQDITGLFRHIVPQGWEIYLDGAHNTGGAQALAAQMADWRAQDQAPIHIVFAMLQSKNPADFVRPIMTHTASITTMTIPDEPKSYTADELARHVRDTGFVGPVFVAEDVTSAIGQVLQSAQNQTVGGRIVICGSLYLAGHVLRTHG